MEEPMTGRRRMTGLRAVLACVAVFLAAGCRDDSPPVLTNLAVDFAPYDGATGAAGSFLFTLNEDKVFLEFNAEVPGPDGPKLLPTFEYRIDPSANVLAPVSGEITRFDFQESQGDYEIAIAKSDRSEYEVSIDHLTNITVGKGDKVSAGDVLGNPGTWSATLGRVELMVTGPSSRTAHCPFTYFGGALKDEFIQRVIDHMSEWEAFKGDTSIYDEAQMVVPGCNDLKGSA